MGATAAVHPADPILQAFGLGKLDDVSSASVSQHLERCDTCQQRVAELSSDEFLGRLQQAKVMPDRAASGWSPSAGSSTEGISGPIVPPPPADTLPPELVDHPDWEIVRELGRGGMGVVYLANNRLMGRPEVLKVVGRHLIERPGVADRFLREIRSAGRLQHPNIVTAYSARQLGQSLVFAMEYVKGYDLAKLVKSSGPLPIAHSCHFIHQAALGLQHALENDMVHRDIKPANLIVRAGKKGILKVLDFGLAKVTIEGQADAGLTREGQMLGTPHYIAPEQIRNAQSADIRADIYSLGCTFYYLLSGGPPFDGDHLWDIYQAHFSMDAGALNLVRPEVPVELAAVVAKMMAKEPGRRFQTPEEVARALTPFFKKASANIRLLNPEVSQVARSQIGQGASASAPLPTQSATNLVPAPAHPAKKPSAPPRPETHWESLIEFKETEPLRVPAPVVSKTVVQKPKWLWPAVAGGISLMVLIAAVAVWQLRIKTANGTILLENIPEDAVVEIDGNKVTVSPKVGEPFKFEALVGTHGLVVRRGDLVLLDESLTLEAGKPFKHKLTARLEPPVLGRPGKIDLPPNMTQRSGTGPAVKGTSSQESITNSIGMTLKLIPAGEFVMGSPYDDMDAGGSEKPQHKVRITNPFYVGIYEVTQAQYQAVTGNNPSFFSSTGIGTQSDVFLSTQSNGVHFSAWAPGGGKDKVAVQSTRQHPVDNVSWLDAVRFCNELNRKVGLNPFYDLNGENVEIPDRNRVAYRLPTEAEWEYACRAGTTTKYSFGDDPSELDKFGWYDGNSGGATHPVGEKRPNDFGLYDMHGNVWEWCWDWVDIRYYVGSPIDDPPGGRAAVYRAPRGGGYRYHPRYLRSSCRNEWRPDYRNDTVGFRVALGQSAH